MKYNHIKQIVITGSIVAPLGLFGACSSIGIQPLGAGGVPIADVATGGTLAIGGSPGVGGATGVDDTPSVGGAPLDSGTSDDRETAHNDASSGYSGKYVALGSSFAAGPKIPDSVPGQSCGRSTNNYAHLIATELGLNLTDVSCSGAIIDNVALTPQGSNALQIAAITPDTQIVTITLGGNDVRYSASLIACGQDGANGTSCLGSDVDAAAIDALLGVVEQKLVVMLMSVAQAAPRAHIFLVGYPMILPAPPAPCPPRAPFESADATFLSDVGKKLQDAFAAAAAEAGVHFVDVYAASHGHDVCAPDGQRWVEGQDLPAAAPFHPNATGMRAQADLIEAEIRRAL